MPKKIRPIEPEEAVALMDGHDARQATEEQRSVLIQLGRVGAIHDLAAILTIQTIKGMQFLRDSEAHKADGFSRFDDWVDHLNALGQFPMKYRKFNEQEALFLREGDAYELLTGLGLPTIARKQLPPGAVKIEDDSVVIGTDQGEERIPISDKQRIRQMLKDLADANVQKAEQIEAGRKQVGDLERKLKKLDAEVDSLSREKERLEREQPVPMTDNSPIESALGALLVAASKVETVVRALPDPQGIQSQVLREWQRADVRLRHALGLISDDELALHDVLAAEPV